MERDGWAVKCQRSHVILRKPDISTVVSVPMHARDTPRGTLAGILRDTGLSDDQFAELLRQ